MLQLLPSEQGEWIKNFIIRTNKAIEATVRTIVTTVNVISKFLLI
jgi:hypothetical protein